MKHFYCSRISTFIIALFIVFVAWINKFDYWENNIVALAFFIKRAKINFDNVYSTWLNQTFASIPTFYNTLLNANIKSASY